jgi:hypothetical protein
VPIKIDVDGYPAVLIATKITLSTADVTIDGERDVCVIMRVDGRGRGGESTTTRENMFTVAVNINDAIECHTDLGRALEGLALQLLAQELAKRGLAVKAAAPADKTDGA